MHENEIARLIVNTAYNVHTTLDPGLLESVYEILMVYELQKLGLMVAHQVAIPVIYENIKFDEGFRADLVVADKVIRAQVY